MNTKQLRQKILDLAIRGKLVPQDPDDEPASVLLEQVRIYKGQMIDTEKKKNEKHLPHITDEDIPFELPDNWAWARLDDVGTTNIGLTYKPTDICNDGIPVMRSSNIKDGRFDFTDLIRVNTPLTDALKLNKGDIVICARNGSRHLVGKCALVHEMTEPLTFGAFMAVYRSICNHYVYYFLNTDLFRSIFQSEGISTQINQLTQAMIKQTIIPLPPFAEQQRIVAAIESAFAVIDEIERNKTDLQAAVAAAKQKILSLAIQGKLVPQDPEDEPASALLERICINKKEKKVFSIVGDESLFNIPKNWILIELGRICEIITGSTPSKNNKAYYGDEYPFYKPTDLDMGFNVISAADMLSEKGFEISRKLPANTVLVTCIGATIGKTGIIRTAGCSNQQINSIIPKINIIPEYIYFVCISVFFQEQIAKNASATTLPIINKGNFEKLLFILPPFAEQQRIVTAIQLTFEQLDKIVGNLK